MNGGSYPPCAATSVHSERVQRKEEREAPGMLRASRADSLACSRACVRCRAPRGFEFYPRRQSYISEMIPAFDPRWTRPLSRLKLLLSPFFPFPPGDASSILTKRGPLASYAFLTGAEMPARHIPASPSSDPSLTYALPVKKHEQSSSWLWSHAETLQLECAATGLSGG
jgi:hypothetical protein